MRGPYLLLTTDDVDDAFASTWLNSFPAEHWHGLCSPPCSAQQQAIDEIVPAQALLLVRENQRLFL